MDLPEPDVETRHLVCIIAEGENVSAPVRLEIRLV